MCYLLFFRHEFIEFQHIPRFLHWIPIQLLAESIQYFIFSINPDEDECYFENEGIWKKYDPISIAQSRDVNNLKIYLDDGNNDEGRFYIACEKLYGILKEKNVDVKFNLFEGHHNAEYILANLEKYFKFYNS